MLTMYWKKVLPVGKSYFTWFNFEKNASRKKKKWSGYVIPGHRR